MLEIIKVLCSCRDLNSGSLHTTANKILGTERLKDSGNSVTVGGKRTLPRNSGKCYGCVIAN
jgi:hypothetical protein